MFANAFQSGFISVFYSIGSNPLSLWDKSVKNGHIRRVVDDEVKSLVLELSGTNVATTYITCPIKARASLGIKLPFLVMVVKNMKKYFTFEIQIADDKDMRRRFRVSNFQSTTKVRPFCTTMPIGLSPGWNQIQFNLADFTKRAYGSSYLETVRVQIHANVRIRRIYFSDRLYGDDEMPQEFKLFLPIPGTTRRHDPNKDKDEKRSSQEIQRKTTLEMEMEAMGGAPPPATPVGEEEGVEQSEQEVTPGAGAAEDSEALPTEISEVAATADETVTESPDDLTTITEEVTPDAAPAAEEGAPAEAPAGEEAPAAEEAPADEAPPPAEEAPAEAPPAEEPPAEEPPPAD